MVVRSLVESISVGQWVSQSNGERLEGMAERDGGKELGGGVDWRLASRVPMEWR